jgi:BON domain
MKKSKLWQAFLAVSIAALAVPTVVQSQTSGGLSPGSSQTMGSNSPSGSSSHDPGMSSGTESTHSGSSTMGSSGTMGRGSSSSHAGMSAAADQGMTQADRTLNQNIHQALNVDSALAISSKNVHLTTDNGKVTLHGTVATEKEKSDIEAKIEKMTGVKDVDNQLQIAPSTSSAAGSMGSTSNPRSSSNEPMSSVNR